LLQPPTKEKYVSAKKRLAADVKIVGRGNGQWKLYAGKSDTRKKGGGEHLLTSGRKGGGTFGCFWQGRRTPTTVLLEGTS